MTISVPTRYDAKDPKSHLLYLTRVEVCLWFCFGGVGGGVVGVGVDVDVQAANRTHN